MAETTQEIHNRMLSNTSDEQDRSNGSFVFDVEKAAAIEFEIQQQYIDEVRKKNNIENLTGEELARTVYARTGINRRLATKAQLSVVISGAEGAQIKTGDIVATDTVDFVVLRDNTVASNGSMIVSVECAQAGRIGNVPANSINRFPTTIPGLINVYNPDRATNGYDEETDIELKQRYYDKLQRPGKAGNKFHYKEWAKEVAGVGAAKVFPCFNGPLTIQVIVIDQDRLPAASDLVNKVKAHLAEEMPFGVEELNVLSAEAKSINLTVLLTLQDGFNESVVIAEIKKNITEYLKEIAFETNRISYARVGSIVIDSEGVLDYQDLLINGTASNVEIPEKSVAVMGGIN